MKSKVVNNILGERVKAAREKAELSQPQLAQIIGVGQSAIAEIEAGRIRRPKKMRELAKALKTTEQWLLAEEVNALEHEELDLEAHEAVKIKDYKKRAGEVFERDVVGGMGQGGYSSGTIIDGRPSDNIVDSWIFPIGLLHNELHVKEADVDVIRVDGDSMFPTLSPGDRVMINRRHTRPSPDAVYAIDNGLGIVVKRVELVLGSDPVQIVIKSDNPMHSSQVMLAEDVRIIGKVVFKLARM